jgi:type IV pilus assembly protein PilF
VIRFDRAAILGLAAFLLYGCGSHNPNEMSKPQPERASDINVEIGIDHLRKGNLAAAKEKIDRALEQNSRNANAHSAAGLLYDRLGETKKADSHFDRALSLDSKNPDIANNYAAFLCKNTRYERGEKFALQASKNPLYKTPEVALVNAGNCARAAHELTRAEQHYREAIRLQPRFGAALFSLAELENEQKHYLSARAFFERYLAVARTSPSSLWLGVRIERGLGNAGTANQYAQRLKNEYPSSPETKQLIESERNPG